MPNEIDISGPLPQPVLVDPPNCACRGTMTQAREHTRWWCAVLTTDEVNALGTAVSEDRPFTLEERVIVEKAGVEIAQRRTDGRYDG